MQLKNNKAFTLLELLMVLAITSILWMISMQGLTQINNYFIANTVQQELLQTINFARVQARLQHEDVVLAIKKDHWEISIQNKIIKIVKIDLHHGTLHWRSFPYYREYLVFQGIGLLKSDNGTFWFCEQRANLPVWIIAINKAGRVKDSNQQLRC